MNDGHRPRTNVGGGQPPMPGGDCPSCGQRAFARQTGKKSLLYSEVYYVCRDVIGCGHHFVVGISVLRTVRPSVRPDPLESLPMTTWRAAANDRAANDDGPPNEPAADAMTN